MIIKIQNEEGLGIGDIKRTYQLHMNHLKLQLNLYRLGYMQSYGKEITNLKCIHLRKWLYDYVDVSIDENYARRALTTYLEESSK